ncbi:ComEA family DNA-binding protein [Kitasatospora sp. NPDC094015]|uniref:ComEA family DNA-binding protein n=1 Tax=Kitasatospora sp. NPDC094015 TaxID=3155205 RepID=UPI003327B542
MGTMTPGAARRRETSEAVRDRMAHLFTAPRGERPDVPERSAELPPEPPPAPPAIPDPAFDQVPEPELAPMPPRSGRRWPGLHPGLLVDRRAVLGLSVLLLLAVGYAVQHFWLGRPHPVAVPTTAVAEPPERPAGAGPPAASPPDAATSSDASAPAAPSALVSADSTALVVDVAGRVLHPGLRRLPGGSRVADAVAAAGGPVPGTDTENLNLARVLTDGEQILVGPQAGQAGQPAVTGSTVRAGPLSLNRATIEQLDTLPGVGPTLAQRIVQYRQEHGPFRSVDQLRQVSGIGARKYEELKALLSL